MGTMKKLLDHRLLIVTGKGGTGKTTISSILGLIAASEGKNTLIIEVSGAAKVAKMFGKRPRHYIHISLAPNLELLSMTSESALEDFAIKQLKIRALYRLVFKNRIISPFIDAVPGLHDLIQLGKIYDLTTEKSGSNYKYDLIILDAPATGHGITMLKSPSSMMEMTQSGPFYKNAKLVADLFTNPNKTGIVLTSLPENLPTNETIDLFDSLGPLQNQVCTCVLNKIQPSLKGLNLWPEVRGNFNADLQPMVNYLDHLLLKQKTAVAAKTTLSEALSVPILSIPHLIGPPDTVGLKNLSEILVNQ